MRLFISINLPENMQRVLSNIQKDLYTQGIRGKYSPPENLHLTLAFIGEYPDAQRVMDALNSFAFYPFTLALDGMGRFKDLWWVGLEESAALTALSRRVRRALAENGIPFDRKRFTPHITLIRKASGAWPEIQMEKSTMTVQRISLMQSTRGRSGMIYTELGTREAYYI